MSLNYLTLPDWAKRIDPDGKTPSIVELLAQTNEMLEDIPFVEANNMTSHRTTIRTGLPRAYWTLINQGSRSSKSTTAQIDEGIGHVEEWSRVHKRLADLGGNTNAFRLSEAEAFVEGINQEFQSTVLYGNSGVAPAEFNGLSVRYSDLAAGNRQNILNAGGTGQMNNSSIWLICWGPNLIHGVFPKGSMAGLKHTNFGMQVKESGIDGNSPGENIVVYEDLWEWDAGLVVRNWQAAVRICNVNIAELVARGNAAADLLQLMTRATHRLPRNKNMGKSCFYMNRTCFQELDLQRIDKASGAGLRYKEVDGMEKDFFRKYPIRIVDALLETEALVA